MDTLERLRGRLATCDELHGLVRTMKSLAAVSVHQHDHAVRALTVYRRTVELALQVVLRGLEPQPPLARVASDAPLGAVVFGSDHGMCGRFNEEVGLHAARALGPERRTGTRLRLVAVGGRAESRLTELGLDVEATHAVPGTIARITGTVRGLLVELDRWRAEGVGRVWLIHAEPVGAAGYRPTLQRLLPLDPGLFAELARKPWESRGLPTFTMPADALLGALLRQHLFVSLFRACAESIASENGARLLAMQGAEKGLEGRAGALGAALRRQRQETITAELLDVIGGYEAQRGGRGSDDGR